MVQKTNYFGIINIDKALEMEKTTNLHDTWYFNGFNNRNNVGCVSYLYKKYDYPKTYKQFYERYVNDDNTGKLEENGRTEDYLVALAESLKEKDNNRFEIWDYYSYIYKKLIFDTFNGLKKEKEFRDMLTASGVSNSSPTYEEDIDYGIDIKVHDNDGNLKCLLQVKPNTFFKGDRNNALRHDRQRAIQKEKIAKETYKVPVYYVIYEKNTGKWIKNKKGKFCHLLKNLINADGTT